MPHQRSSRCRVGGTAAARTSTQGQDVSDAELLGSLQDVDHALAREASASQMQHGRQAAVVERRRGDAHRRGIDRVVLGRAAAGSPCDVDEERVALGEAVEARHQVPGARRRARREELEREEHLAVLDLLVDRLDELGHGDDQDSGESKHRDICAVVQERACE